MGMMWNIYLISVVFYWITAVIYYNSDTYQDANEMDLVIMIVPLFNVVYALLMWSFILRIDKISISKVVFLSFRKKGK